MIKLVIFDFDGTLVDSKSLFVETIHGSLLKNYYVFPKSKIAKALGPKVEITLKNIEKFNPEITNKLKKDINKWISQKTKDLKLCPYVEPVLGTLKKQGIIFIVLTNSSRKYTLSLLKKKKILKFFDKIFCAEDFDYKEQAIKKIIKDFKVKRGEVVYVADKESDIETARKAGVKIIITLACSWEKAVLSTRAEKFIIKNLAYLKDAISV